MPPPSTPSESASTPGTAELPSDSPSSANPSPVATPGGSRDEGANRTRLARIEALKLELAAEQQQLETELARQRLPQLLAPAPREGPESELRAAARRMSISLGWPNPHDWQLDAVCDVLEGRHTAVVWPAGGGKSLRRARRTKHVIRSR